MIYLLNFLKYLNTNVFNLRCLEMLSFKSGLELSGNGKLERISIPLVDDDVDLIGQRSDNLSTMGLSGLEVDSDARGLVHHDGGCRNVDLHLDLVRVGDLERRNNILKDDCSLSTLVERDGRHLALHNNNTRLQVGKKNRLFWFFRSNHKILTTSKFFLQKKKKKKKSIFFFLKKKKR